MKKRCKDCGEWFELTEFYTTRLKYTNEITYYSRCKTCYMKHRRAVENGTEEKDRQIEGDSGFKRMPYNELEKDNIEAYKAGMSYGQWQAQQYMKKIKEKKHD